MKKLFSFIAVALITAVCLTACEKKSETHVVSADEQRAEHLANSEKNRKLQAMLEQNRSTAMDSIKFNAAGYFASNPRFQPASDWTVIAHTDDYINEACPQGSGWGWVNVMNTKLKDADGKPTKIRLYCSTSSSSLGCYKDDDFKSGPHSAEASRCNATLPSPLTPIKG